MASLVDYPQLILDVVVTPLWLLLLDVLQEWLVANGVRGDFFPCYRSGGPIYSHGNELCMDALLCWRRLTLSYEAIKSSLADEAMMDMTGAPCITI